MIRLWKSYYVTRRISLSLLYLPSQRPSFRGHWGWQSPFDKHCSGPHGALLIFPPLAENRQQSSRVFFWILMFWVLLCSILAPQIVWYVDFRTLWIYRPMSVWLKWELNMWTINFSSEIICRIFICPFPPEDPDSQTHDQPQPIQICSEVWRFGEMRPVWRLGLCSREDHGGRQGESFTWSMFKENTTDLTTVSTL